MTEPLQVDKSAVPKDSRDAAIKFLGAQGITNPGLLFDHFLPRADMIKEGEKQAALSAICESAGHTHRGLLSAWHARWQAAAAGAGAQTFARATCAPLIIGFGRKGAFEIGFTFHRYGFPYLPGSGVKGMARAFAFFDVLAAAGNFDLEQLEEEKVAERLEDLENELAAPDPQKFEDTLQHNWPAAAHDLARMYRKVFGTQKDAGRAIFFDAIPRPDGDKRLALVVDVLTPHYPKYTDGAELPTGWQDPTPVPFLAVKTGTVFCFAVGWRGDPDTTAQEQAALWLQKALAQIGAGAKTTAGYGYFRETEPNEARPLQPAQSPFVDEVVFGSVSDAGDKTRYWVALDGYSTEENEILYSIVKTPGMPTLVDDDRFRARISKSYKKGTYDEIPVEDLQIDD